MDTEGRRVLADMHKENAAHFIADTPMTKYFAEEARGETQNDTKENT
jgi:hypothetical protein